MSRKILVYWAPIFLYVGLIFLLSSLSSLPVRLPAFAHADKLAHFVEYALLAFLMARAICSLGRPSSGLAIFSLTVLIACVLGGLDELYQSTVAHRSSDWRDFIADAVGALIGAGAYLMLRRTRLRRTAVNRG